MSTKILEILTQLILKSGVYNKHDQIAPAAVLWTDKERQWEPLIPQLREIFPQLLTLGAFAPETKIGPSIWIKCMIARTLPEANWPENDVPILYLPGISRLELRAVESCSPELQPLAELQYRGAFWSQKNGKDWTLYAFLKSADGGAGLDVAQDDKTLQAMRRAFIPLLHDSVEAWKGKRLEAHDFDKLLAPDPVRNLLSWLNDSGATKNQWSHEEWEAFTALCKAEFSFNPVIIPS